LASKSRSFFQGRLRRKAVSKSRIALYFFIAFIALVIAYYNLVDEPKPEWPINLVHFLIRH
jgi:hypothetical protein